MSAAPLENENVKELRGKEVIIDRTSAYEYQHPINFGLVFPTIITACDN